MKHQARIEEIAASVRELRRALLEREREAGELVGGEDQARDANNMVAATRLALDAALSRYFDDNEWERAKRCPIHGSHALIVSCSDCARAWTHSARGPA